jgi:hypothetical protein
LCRSFFTTTSVAPRLLETAVHEAVHSVLPEQSGSGVSSGTGKAQAAPQDDTLALMARVLDEPVPLAGFRKVGTDRVNSGSRNTKRNHRSKNQAKGAPGAKAASPNPPKAAGTTTGAQPAKAVKQSKQRHHPARDNRGHDQKRVTTPTLVDRNTYAKATTVTPVQDGEVLTMTVRRLLFDDRSQALSAVILFCKGREEAFLPVENMNQRWKPGIPLKELTVTCLVTGTGANRKVWATQKKLRRHNQSHI